MVRIIIGNPVLKNRLKDMSLPDPSARPAATTLADAPMIVPLPPRQAPRARGVQRAELKLDWDVGKLDYNRHHSRRVRYVVDECGCYHETRRSSTTDTMSLLSSEALEMTSDMPSAILSIRPMY